MGRWFGGYHRGVHGAGLCYDTIAWVTLGMALGLSYSARKTTARQLCRLCGQGLQTPRGHV